MRVLHLSKSSLKGTIVIPPSKSHTLRALLFGSRARGKSVLYQYLPSPDTEAMVRALRAFGITTTYYPDRLEVEGGVWQPPEEVIDAGNSGQVLRFVSALAALLPVYTMVTGDRSVRENRPIEPLLSALRQLGGFAVSARGNGTAPLIVRGPLRAGRALLSGEDSQPVSGVLMAASFLEGETHLEVTDPGETPWIDLTLSWLRRLAGISHTCSEEIAALPREVGSQRGEERVLVTRTPFSESQILRAECASSQRKCEKCRLGGEVSHEGYRSYQISGPLSYEGFTVKIPGDLSSAAFPLAAALVTHGELTLENVDLEEVQGDKKFFTLLREWGALLEYDSIQKRVRIAPSSSLSGGRVDVNGMIDALPILAVVACYAEKKVELFNAAIARKKESDRIHAITTELRKMGAEIEEEEGGMTITPAPLHGAVVSSQGDHRIALALSVAALGAEGTTTIVGTECIAKSYPSFVEDFQRVGARITL